MATSTRMLKHLPVKSKGIRIEIFDTTLRDGTQSEHVAYSADDKIRIAHVLDRLGVDYIEGGWPGSNPKDMGFFDRAKNEKWKNARITAFGSTRHAKNKPNKDPNLKALVDSEAPVLIIFGKSWDFHVKHALRVGLGDNLDMIRTSVEYLSKHCEKMLYDAEHFFDGYKHHSDYALKTLDAAVEGGAECLILCDTNGGSTPCEIASIVGKVKDRFDGIPIGIHPHNDAGLAVANALYAVNAGATHVQGTINGFGERCGNVDLIQVVANLNLKLGYDCLKGQPSMRRLTEVSRFVHEIGNLPLRDNQPYVGRSAFAHKGGIHVSAVARNARTYEHVDPESVGNSRRVLISELSGRSNLMATHGKRFGLDERPQDAKKVLKRLMELENQGYVFEAADASFELLVRKALDMHEPFFHLRGFRVITDVDDQNVEITEATVKIDVDGQVEHTACDGNGPVNALDGALRKALDKFYPELMNVHLTDYKVRVVNPREATAAKVLVSITSSDQKRRWTTVGVSENIIEASWHALVDSVDFHLYQTRGKRSARRKKVAV